MRRPQWQVFLTDKLSENGWIPEVKENGDVRLKKMFDAEGGTMVEKSILLKTSVISRELFEDILVEHCDFEPKNVEYVSGVV